ncbi:MAG: acyl-CoA dehydrogenase family protein [Thermodesulfobacteriota bacterium]|nr:acyl-CoA dehydrogenase family protein [Thermodesulfobacteriota bacterium]
MDYNFNQEELNIRDTIRQFAKKEVAPLVDQIEREGKMPEDLINKIIDLKISGLPFPEKWGGSGASFVSLLLAVEELSYVYLPCMFYSLVSSMAAYGFMSFGSDHLKEKYLTGLLTGSITGAWAFTEPDTGSDPKQLKMKAVKDGDDWILNGTKRFITNSGRADIAVIFATSEDGITAFVVETDNPGYTVGRREQFLAFNGTDNGDIILEDARVKSENILGKVGEGFNILLGVEVFAKVASCAGNVGLARAALDLALQYAKEKTHRGTPIGLKFQMTQWNIATMAAKVAASQAFLYSVGAKMDKGENVSSESSLLKIFTGGAAREVASDAVQVHGAYGLSKEYAVERLYREARFNEVILGTNELQRVIAANVLLRS